MEESSVAPMTTFHKMMQPKIQNLLGKMAICLEEQGAPEHVRTGWNSHLTMLRDGELMFCHLVVESIIKKWLRHHTPHKGETDNYVEYSLDLTGMEKDREDAIKRYGGLSTLLKSSEEAQQWHDCVNWPLNDQGKKLINDYFCMFAKVYITYYSEEGFEIPEIQ